MVRPYVKPKTIEQKFFPLIGKLVLAAAVLAVIGHFGVPFATGAAMIATALTGLVVGAMIVSEGRETAWNETH